MSHFLVPELSADIIRLPKDEAHHALRVLRIREGAQVSATDGAGGLVTGLFRASDAPSIEVVHRSVAQPSKSRLTVAFALTKGSKPELVVEKLTELGVDSIRPVWSARSVVNWDQRKRDSALERFVQVSRSALKQSKRCFLPEVHAVCEVFDLALGDHAVVLHVSDSSAPLDVSGQGDVTLLVGPEGGWTDDEVAEFASRGARIAGSGEGVLRAETAAIAFGALALSQMSKF